MGWFKPIRKRISAFMVLSLERFQEFRTTLIRNTTFHPEQEEVDVHS